MEQFGGNSLVLVQPKMQLFVQSKLWFLVLKLLLISNEKLAITYKEGYS